MFIGADELRNLMGEPDDQEMIEACIGLKKVLDSLILAGFTEDQAIKFLAESATAQGREGT